jgi:hypothetical protein
MLDFFQILATIYQILMVLTKLIGCHSSESLKLLLQTALTGETDL